MHIDLNEWKQRLGGDSASAITDWLDRVYPGLVERVQRLTALDSEYRFDQAHRAIPAYLWERIPQRGDWLSVHRALPAGRSIRPGDWVALNRRYAERHVRGEATELDLLEVHATDVYWAGTDENEFFYLPRWARNETGEYFSVVEFLRAMPAEQLPLLLHGEMSSLKRFETPIETVKAECLASFDEDRSGAFHGPDHWARVHRHALMLARASGIDPLLPCLFAWVHDSHREDDGLDPEHGPRAAQFILERRRDLFGFLSDDQVEHLRHACQLHSNGIVHGPASAQVSWDADRLDLWRVGVRPDPRYLCTDFAKVPEVIQNASIWLQDDPEGPAIRLHMQG
jgi:uncharacterized protein